MPLTQRFLLKLRQVRLGDGLKVEAPINGHLPLAEFHISFCEKKTDLQQHFPLSRLSRFRHSRLELSAAW